MMRILELPTEILDGVFCSLVETHGVRLAVRTKHTCRAFNRGVSLAIWSTRALEAPEARFQREPKSEYLFADYLLQRTRADRIRRTHKVTAIIYDTIDYLKRIFGVLSDPSHDYLQEACLALVRSKEDIVLWGYHRQGRAHEALKQRRDRHTVQENAMALAAYLGLHAIVEQLVSQGVRDRPTCFGSPLICMSKAQDVSIIDTYLRARLKLHGFSRPIFKSKALLCAGHLTVATFHKAHARDISSEMYGDAIAAATIYGRSETVKLLVEASIQDGETSACIPSVQMCEGEENMKLGLLPDRWTHLLIYAAEWGKPDVVQLALDNGADPNVRCYMMTGWSSALGNASLHGDAVIFKQLLHHGADLKRAIDKNIDFFDKVAGGGSLEIAKLCVDAGLRKQAIAPEWLLNPHDEPVYSAIRHGQPEILRLLLARGLGFGPHPSAESLLMSYAENLGNREVVELLNAFRNGQLISE